MAADAPANDIVDGVGPAPSPCSASAKTRASIHPIDSDTLEALSRWARQVRPEAGLRNPTMWQVVAESEPKARGPSPGWQAATSPWITLRTYK